MKCSREEQWRLRCEQLENEAWSSVSQFKNELHQALENSKNPTEEQRNLIYAAAGVALMHINVVNAEDNYFGLKKEDNSGFVMVESDN